MNEKQVLELLLELVRDAVITRTADDDPSGIYTTYLVDQEQLMKNIQDRLEKQW